MAESTGAVGAPPPAQSHTPEQVRRGPKDGVDEPEVSPVGTRRGTQSASTGHGDEEACGCPSAKSGGADGERGKVTDGMATNTGHAELQCIPAPGVDLAAQRTPEAGDGKVEDGKEAEGTESAPQEPSASESASAWFSANLSTTDDPAMIMAAPAPLDESEACVLRCCKTGTAADGDYVIPRTCSDTGRNCLYHRSCLDTQVRAKDVLIGFAATTL